MLLFDTIFVHNLQNNFKLRSRLSNVFEEVLWDTCEKTKHISLMYISLYIRSKSTTIPKL